MGVFFIVAINIINRYNHINHMERKEKMKPYFAISFLIVFMQIYALGAEEGVSPQTDPADDTEQTEVVTQTCKIYPGEACPLLVESKEISAGTHVLCKEEKANDGTITKTWQLCTKKSSGSGVEIEDIEKTTYTPCDKGYFFFGNKCLSCKEQTGEKDATTKDTGNATTMNDCILPEKSGSDYLSYQDEKGTFTYLGDCMIACTEETEYYCTSV